MDTGIIQLFAAIAEKLQRSPVKLTEVTIFLVVSPSRKEMTIDIAAVKNKGIIHLAVNLYLRRIMNGTPTRSVELITNRAFSRNFACFSLIFHPALRAASP